MNYREKALSESLIRFRPLPLWAAIISVDGLTAAEWGTIPDADRAGAMAAAALSLGGRITHELGMGEYQESFLRGSDGTFFVTTINQSMVLSVAFKEVYSWDDTLYEVRQVAMELDRLLAGY